MLPNVFYSHDIAVTYISVRKIGAFPFQLRLSPYNLYIDPTQTLYFLFVTVIVQVVFFKDKINPIQAVQEIPDNVNVGRILVSCGIRFSEAFREHLSVDIFHNQPTFPLHSSPRHKRECLQHNANSVQLCTFTYYHKQDCHQNIHHNKKSSPLDIDEQGGDKFRQI